MSMPAETYSTIATLPLTRSPAWGAAANPGSGTCWGASSTTPQAVLAQPLELVTDPPLDHRDRRSVLGVGLDLELVHEPSRPREAQAETAPRGEAVRQCRTDVTDAGTGVARHDDEPVPVWLLAGVEQDLSGPDVDDDVARDLGDRRGQERRVRAGKAKALGQGATLGARRYEVGVPGDRDPDLILHRRCPPTVDGPAAPAPRRDRGRPEAVRDSAGSAPWRWRPPAGCRPRSSAHREDGLSTRSLATTSRRTSR